MNSAMKGIILAGGSGTRLHTITKGMSKQLLLVYDKPMIYYTLSALILAGICDILIVTTPDDQVAFQRLLGDGGEFGIRLSYKIQACPDGLAQAFLIGEDFIGSDNVRLVLGDDIFYGKGLRPMLQEAASQTRGATVFGYRVKDPHRFVVVEFDAQGKAISIEENPVKPKSYRAVTGLYFYDNEVINIAKPIRPSDCGELEITTVNLVYIARGDLRVQQLGRGVAWLDTGKNKSLLNAAQFVETIETRRGYKITCREEIAHNQGWLSSAQPDDLAKPFQKSGNGESLLSLHSSK